MLKFRNYFPFYCTFRLAFVKQTIDLCRHYLPCNHRTTRKLQGRGCRSSFSGGTSNPPECDPVQPVLGEPDLAGGLISKGHFHSQTFCASIITPQRALEVIGPALQTYAVDEITGSSC